MLFNKGIFSISIVWTLFIAEYPVGKKKLFLKIKELGENYGEINFMNRLPCQVVFMANIILHYPEKASGIYEKVIGCIRKAFTFLPFCIAGFHFGDS